MNYYSSDNVYFKLRGYNSQCGYGGWKYFTFDVISCGGGYLLAMSPNPAESEVTLTVTEEDKNSRENESLRLADTGITFEVFDNSNQSLLKTTKSLNNKGKAVFNIKSLQPGSYIAHIVINEKLYTQHLVIE